jgi:hypothetical protein
VVEDSRQLSSQKRSAKQAGRTRRTAQKRAGWVLVVGGEVGAEQCLQTAANTAGAGCMRLDSGRRRCWCQTGVVVGEGAQADLLETFTMVRTGTLILHPGLLVGSPHDPPAIKLPPIDLHANVLCTALHPGLLLSSSSLPALPPSARQRFPRRAHIQVPRQPRRRPNTEHLMLFLLYFLLHVVAHALLHPYIQYPNSVLARNRLTISFGINITITPVNAIIIII